MNCKKSWNHSGYVVQAPQWHRWACAGQQAWNMSARVRCRGEAEGQRRGIGTENLAPRAEDAAASGAVEGIVAQIFSHALTDERRGTGFRAKVARTQPIGVQTALSHPRVFFNPVCISPFLQKRIRKLEASNKRLEDANTDLKSRRECRSRTDTSRAR